MLIITPITDSIALYATKSKANMKHSVYLYYDESTRSRKLTLKTFNDSRFRLNFIATIVGISKENFETFKKNINFKIKIN